MDFSDIKFDENTIFMIVFVIMGIAIAYSFLGGLFIFLLIVVAIIYIYVTYGEKIFGKKEKPSYE